MTAVPLGLTVAFSVADVSLTAEASPVTAVGGRDRRCERFERCVVAFAFGGCVFGDDPEVVGRCPALRPLIAAVTASGLVPEPGVGVQGAVLP